MSTQTEMGQGIQGLQPGRGRAMLHAQVSQSLQPPSVLPRVKHRTRSKVSFLNPTPKETLIGGEVEGEELDLICS